MKKQIPDTTWLDHIEIVGGHPAVDFINTVHSYTEPTPRDYLESADHVLGWHLHQGLIHVESARRLASLSPVKRKKLLTDSLALRATLYAVFKGHIDARSDAPALACLNRELETLARWRTLDADAGSFAWHCHVTPEHPHSLLGPVAFAAAELLRSKDLKRLKVCPGDDCGWLFLDHSRNGSRTWCSMKTCGNIAKQRRHRTRQVHAD